jgi:1,4-dihydroxy-2-naphthoate polyprenyltransferase
MTLNYTNKMLRIIRRHIVIGGILAFTLGALLIAANGGTFDLGKAALFYTVVFLGDLSTHYSNDYFYTEADKHVKRKKLFSGNHIFVDNSQLHPIARLSAIALLMLSCGLATAVVLFQVAPIELLIITVAINFLG